MYVAISPTKKFYIQNNNVTHVVYFAKNAVQQHTDIENKYDNR